MPATAEGYVYADETAGVMATARAGMRIAVERRRPPFIEVHDSIQAVAVTRWPGKLWHVRILDPVTEADERATGFARSPPNSGYTRAVAVEVLEEIPAARLFGDHGDEVCAILARARQFNWNQASYFAKTRHPDAGRAYSRAWSNWLLSVGIASPFRIDFISVVDTSALRDADFTGVLGTSAHPGSPVNDGLKVLHRTILERAKEMIEPPAYFVDAEGEENLGPIWLAACYALLEAAMALGAPTVSVAEDRRIMCKAWYSVTSPNLLTGSS